MNTNFNLYNLVLGDDTDSRVKTSSELRRATSNAAEDVAHLLSEYIRNYANERSTGPSMITVKRAAAVIEMLAELSTQLGDVGVMIDRASISESDNTDTGEA